MAETNELVLIDKQWAIDTIQSVPQLLQQHKARASKALQVGQSILDQLTAAGGEMTAEIDERAMAYLTNCKKARTEMEEARKPATQLMDEIKSMFTAEEANLDPKKSKTLIDIQGMRDGWARKLIEDQERNRKAAELKAAIAKKEEQIASYIREAIAIRLDTHIKDRKLQITAAFNQITLDNYEEKAAGLKAMPTAFNIANNALGKILQYPIPQDLHPLDEIRYDQIRAEQHNTFDLSGWYVEYSEEMTELKDRLTDRLPALKAELDEAKRAKEESERLRIAAEQAKGEEAKLRAKQAAEQAEADQARITAETEARKANEAAAIHQQAEANRKRIEEEEAMKQQAAAAEALFNQAVDSAVTTAAPETRNGYEITVLHQAGWVEIFQLWYQREGVKMTIADMGSKKLDSMKKFCEDLAKKEDIKINSKYIKYETSIKAVNRKAAK